MSEGKLGATSAAGMPKWGAALTAKPPDDL